MGAKRRGVASKIVNKHLDYAEQVRKLPELTRRRDELLKQVKLIDSEIKRIYLLKKS